MTFNLDNIKAVIFDYGNTLIEFTETQLHNCDNALLNTLTKTFGPVDYSHLKTIRDADRLAPYSGNFIENDLHLISANLVKQLFDVEPTPQDVQHIVDVRYESFIQSITAPHYLHSFLNQLKKKYTLGLLSNYPCGKAIRTTLANIDIADYFDSVVVSGDVGHVKPHPLPFRKILDELNVEPHQAIFVGDNWLGDIQGAKRIGMKAAHTLQFDTPEYFEPQQGDHQPDITINHLTELTDLLL